MPKICNTCSPSDRWRPTPIGILENYLYKGFLPIAELPNTKAIRKNIAYNLQYIQFIVQFQEEIQTTTVIVTQNWKMLTIAGMSIIETILLYILISRNLHKKTEWESIPEIKIQNEKEINGVKYQVQIQLFKRIPEQRKEMKLDDMIKIISDKKTLGKNVEVYRKLNHLKKLRNKVHLHAAQSQNDTDWYNFNLNDIVILKEVLRGLLIGSLFKPTEEERKMFDFLKSVTKPF